VKEKLTSAAHLVERLKHEELVQLPTLTREELAVTGSLEASPLRDSSEIDYWNGLTDDARRAAGAAALRSLDARGLVDLTQKVEADASGNVEINSAPELGLILAARRQPSIVAVGSEPQRGLFGFMRLYGVIDERHDMTIVLMERTAESGVHEFGLCLVPRAAHEVSAWACGPDPIENGDKSETLVRTVEVIRPSQSGPSRDRFAVFINDASAELAEVDDKGEMTTRVPITAKALSDRLRSLLDKVRTPR
jgi:hypothetical protein